MTELTHSGNAIAKLMLEALAPSLHGAHIGQWHIRVSVVALRCDDLLFPLQVYLIRMGSLRICLPTLTFTSTGRRP